MQLTQVQKDVIKATGHLLVTGGPGSGKTTISILKAVQLAQQSLQPEQRVLFLSFARASVARVVEAIDYEHDISKEVKATIDVQTYHSFFWRILKAHGYLIGLPRKLYVLTPSDEAIELSNIRSKYPLKGLKDAQKKAQKKAKQQAENEERTRLAFNDGRISFDYYASFVAEILQRSSRIRSLVSSRYPVVVLDEFQDTDADQWQVIKQLAENSCLIALADPEQRIYDWRGADPLRLTHLTTKFNVTCFDMSNDNHRSAGTDIALLGNEVLTGSFSQSTYKGIAFECFEPFSGLAMTKLVTAVYGARKRLIKAGVTDWSIAILVPTKKMTRQVSDALWQPPNDMAAVNHTAVLDMEPAILGAEVIAHLLQPTADESHFSSFISLLCNYFRGKGGSSPTTKALQEADRILKAFEVALKNQKQGKKLHARSIIIKIKEVYDEIIKIEPTGDPDKDWLALRSVLEEGTCIRLHEIAKETRNLRILKRGSTLRQSLTQDWLTYGSYLNALDITRQAFVQAHFSNDYKSEKGVIVMNMHKAKGKQFDEVIIFEGWPMYAKGKLVNNSGRIVRANSIENIDTHARQNLRVSITRGKRQTTILTPRTDPCVIFTKLFLAIGLRKRK